VQVDLLFFASLADVIGARRLSLEVPSGATVERVLDQLEDAHPNVAPYRPVLLTAVNEEYVKGQHELTDGDCVAIFPPVSGGSVSPEQLVIEHPNQYYEITWQTIDTQALARKLSAPSDGAICIFEGIVRDNSLGRETEFLVYEAYESMALKKLEEIGRLVRDVWEIGAIGIVHRLGRLAIGSRRPFQSGRRSTSPTARSGSKVSPDLWSIGARAFAPPRPRRHGRSGSRGARSSPAPGLPSLPRRSPS
jgi:molybdopterin converting factor subunit 1